MRDLRERVVVVTGAASGIGRATARAFLEAGARVHAVDIDEPGLARLRAEATGDLTPHVIDCRDADAVARLADAVHAAHGALDVMHNNAGVVVVGRAETLDVASWRRAIDINLMGVVHGIQAFLPTMVETGKGGHIVNTASVSGLVGFPLCGPYCASKYAVVGLTESLDGELAAHGIRVLALCPGMVDTAVVHNGQLDLPGQGRQMLLDAMARFALRPEDVAAEVLDGVRRGRGGVRVLGLGTRPMWWLRRAAPDGFGLANRWLSRFVLSRTQESPR